MAVHSTHIPGTRTRTGALTIRLRAAWRRYVEEFSTVRTALRWQSHRTNPRQLLTPMSQPIIADRLLDETIGTLWVLSTHAELHHLDPRHIDRANRVRQQFERIKQRHQSYISQL